MNCDLHIEWATTMSDVGQHRSTTRTVTYILNEQQLTHCTYVQPPIY